MKKIILATLVLIAGLTCIGQEIRITFTGTGETSRIDSVRATNLTTGQSVTLPGDATLILTSGSGTGPVSIGDDNAVMYPNPFSGWATLAVTTVSHQPVRITVRDIVGRVVAQDRKDLDAGTGIFTVSVQKPGLYTVCLNGTSMNTCVRMLCIEGNPSGNSVRFEGLQPSGGELKGLSTGGYRLVYVLGDVIVYNVMAGGTTTIFTDSPTGTHNYNVEITSCADAGGNNYPVVKIGEQTWMAKNLAYLPSVSPSSAGMPDAPYYYVYGYEGTSVSAAKSTSNYTVYGVLYNWQAAQSACPSGWHLPNDNEWMTLEKYLGMNPSEAGGFGWRNTGNVGGKLKETGTGHWFSPNTGADNSAGFSALPGSYRGLDDGFYNLTFRAYFWTSTQSDASSAVYRGLYYENGGVDRGNDSRKMGFSVRCLKNDSNTAQLPTVSTRSITDIAQTTATGGGMVTSDGGADVTERGICWNTTGSPTINNEKTTDGSGTGPFVSSISGLTASTPYYVRAYATNSAGTAYGEVKQFSTGNAGGEGTFDFDGKTYPYKTIGTQTWMTENLAYLPAVSPSSSGSDTSPFYYVYEYNSTSVSEAKATANYTTYGVLYNWPAAMNGAAGSTSVPSGVQGICPTGWHLPSDAEWTILTDYLTNNGYGYGGSGDDIGKSMASTSGWISHSTAGTIGNDQGSNNRSGFTALPSGYRLSNGGFYYLGSNANFWSSSEGGTSYAWYRDLNYYGDGVGRFYNYRRDGFSVRCLQN